MLLSPAAAALAVAAAEGAGVNLVLGLVFALVRIKFSCLFHPPDFCFKLVFGAFRGDPVLNILVFVWGVGQSRGRRKKNKKKRL